MESLADRLKSLGVHMGSENVEPPVRGLKLEEAIPGRVIQTSVGETFVVESRFEMGDLHGDITLQMTNPLHTIAAWAGHPGISKAPLESFIFIDTETTGLSGGVGTLAFMVGLGRFDGGGFHLSQFFLREPAEEPAMLAALEAAIGLPAHMVSFNGKSFDYPVLHSRMIANSWYQPWAPTSHMDILHLARRLWREQLPSRALAELEIHILGVKRTEEEVPGWLVPQIYSEYLRTGDPRPLSGVFYHNAMDILSLAALLEHMAGLIDGASPDNAPRTPVETVAIARLCEDLGQNSRAVSLYRDALKAGLPEAIFQDTRRKLSLLEKRGGDIHQALKLWEAAATQGELYAFVELAKYHEHQAGDLSQALEWTQAARNILESSGHSSGDKSQWLSDLDHRMARLVRRLG